MPLFTHTLVDRYIDRDPGRSKVMPEDPGVMPEDPEVMPEDPEVTPEVTPEVSGSTTPEGTRSCVFFLPL